MGEGSSKRGRKETAAQQPTPPSVAMPQPQAVVPAAADIEVEQPRTRPMFDLVGPLEGLNLARICFWVTPRPHTNWS